MQVFIIRENANESDAETSLEAFDKRERDTEYFLNDNIFGDTELIILVEWMD
jgi:hypothetical protein